MLLSFYIQLLFLRVVAPVGKAICKKGQDAPVLFDFDRKLFWGRFLKAMLFAVVFVLRFLGFCAARKPPSDEGGAPKGRRER